MAVQIQTRRGTAAQWTTANTILSQGELGLETDTVKWKFGDGVTAWNSLAYASTPPGSVVDYAGAYSNTKTYHSGEYVVGTDGVTYQCVKDGTVGVSPTPWAPAPSIPYGTSFPTAPVDGQEAVLVDSITNPSYQWRFRFNAGSTSPYKWEFVGGNPAFSEVLTSQSSTSNTYQDIGTVGPSITIPRSGDYMYSLSVQVGQDTAGATAGASVKFGAATAVDTDIVYFGPIAGASGQNASVATNRRVNAATAGDVWKVQYRTGGTGTGYFANRRLLVTPVRVS